MQFQALLDTNKCDDPSEKSLVEAQQQLQKTTLRGKQNAEPSLETKVAKCVRDNFNGCKEDQIYSKLVGGKTLFQRIMNDKLAEAANPAGCKIKFGKHYFSQLRRDYITDAPDDTLQVKDDNVICCPKLFEAVRASRGALSSRDKLVLWLTGCDHAPNQTELVGLLSHLLELRPWLGGTQFSVCMEGLKFLMRHKVPELFPEEFRCYKTQADRTLTHAWALMKAKGFSLQTFWQAYRTHAGPIISLAAVESLLAAKGSWIAVQGDLSRRANWGRPCLASRFVPMPPARQAP